MYPSIYYALKDLFGVDWPAFKMIQSFGFFVAVAFVMAAYVWTKELKRKEKEGLIGTTTSKKLTGQPATLAELITSGLIGFLLGYKLLYIALNFDAFTGNTQGFLLSARGNWLGGLAGAALSVYLKYREKDKTKLAEPKWVEEVIHPYQHVGNLTLIAAFAGLLGAKIFHNLENWNTFIQDPVGALLSFDGLTMYGGLICASVACIWYGTKHGIPFPHLIDSAAPSLMLGYSVGRIGCQVSGDGDWGVFNSAYTAGRLGNPVPAGPAEFQAGLEANSDYFLSQYGSLENVPHTPFQGPSFLPDWMVAYTYPHNVVNDGVPLAECSTDKYCNYLASPVFPTPLYEVLMCLFLFFVLWGLRKRLRIPGVLFCVYLILNGIERNLIEKIRVNTLYHIGDYSFTQAELISTLLILVGVTGLWYFYRKNKLQKIS